ncbi:unnamed protein product [Didymodactylos carnosus]|uniref:DUF5641 domain-containing protein n=1 Tax=Didymodactylos carnosus TaxID=1234261 RepID=A0A814CZW4_9BILA|nr:unnamed protein product [Didymodactylos carnosus]CAF3726008.1 unnamed protein product [Didymodactylos carnosus]
MLLNWKTLRTPLQFQIMTLLKLCITCPVYVALFDYNQVRDDYLLSLRERKNGNKIRRVACDVPQVGQAVLTKENLPRGLWKIGLVQRILPGVDGEVRSAVVRTPKSKQFNRSIKLLYPLECINKGEKVVEKVTDINNGEEEEKEQIKLKSKRGTADRARKPISELFRRECRAQRDFDN